MRQICECVNCVCVCVYTYVKSTNLVRRCKICVCWVIAITGIGSKPPAYTHVCTVGGFRWCEMSECDSCKCHCDWLKIQNTQQKQFSHQNVCGCLILSCMIYRREFYSSFFFIVCCLFVTQFHLFIYIYICTSSASSKRTSFEYQNRNGKESRYIRLVYHCLVIAVVLVCCVWNWIESE